MNRGVSPLVSIASAFFYGIVSLFIILFNKFVLSSFQFHFSSVVCLVQSFIGLGILFLWRSFKMIEFPLFNWDIVRQVGPVSICFIVNVVMGLSAIGNTNIPIFTSLRRLNALFMLCAEYFVLNSTPSRGVIVSVSIMIFGAIIAGIGDLNISLYGYAIVLVNNLCTTLHSVLLKKLQQRNHNLTEVCILYYNLLLSLPFLFLVALLSGQIEEALSWKMSQKLENSSMSFCFSLFLSGVLAFFVNLSVNWCTKVNSPLTTSVIGQAKNIVATILGFVLFNDAIPSNSIVCGLLVGVTGSVAYSIAKYSDQIKLKSK